MMVTGSVFLNVFQNWEVIELEPRIPSWLYKLTYFLDLGTVGWLLDNSITCVLFSLQLMVLDFRSIPPGQQRVVIG